MSLHSVLFKNGLHNLVKHEARRGLKMSRHDGHGISWKRLWHISSIGIILISLAGCSLPYLQPASPTASSPGEGSSQAAALPQAEITFMVALPQDAPEGQSVYLNIVDEVTGLALNPITYPMQKMDARHFGIRLPITLGSVVKYRYTRGTNPPAVEITTTGQQVRYRLYDVTAPGIVQDLVSAWSDQPFNGETGRIEGKVVDATNNAPIPGLMVAAGGRQTFTASDGSFVLNGLPPATHNLVVYALDGAYHTFQQGAVVAAGATTPATIKLTPAPMVNVAFVVTLPKENVEGVPIRLAGNLETLGNTFADLSAGLSSVAARMPTLTELPDGRYSVTLSLHAGTDLRYKYTFGDGFWNAELTKDGGFVLRQFIVPDANTVVQDTVETWRSPKTGYGTFQVTVPANTPATDSVSIQFSPFAWTPPIPMWPTGNNTWSYVLDNPLNLLTNMEYRYCRNDQCDSADDAETAGPAARGRPFKVTSEPLPFKNEIRAWQWWQPSETPTQVVAAQIQPRGSSYIAGIEFQSNYNPTWLPRFAEAFKEVHGIGANWVMLTPSWTFTDNRYPSFELNPASDPLWNDAEQEAQSARSENLNLAIFPAAHFTGDANQWWQTAPRDATWWDMWFDRYGEFATNFADLAAQSNAGALVLGGDWLAPALPEGKLADGSASGVPADAAERWRKILQEVRAHFNGKILWALPYPQGVDFPPSFLDAVDQIYLMLSAPIASQPNPSETDLENDLGSILDGKVRALQQQVNKPVVIAADFPSAKGLLSSCLPARGGGCLSLDILSRPNPDIPSLEVDLQAQVDAYNALFVAANQRDWIAGVVSRGYYPPAALEDKSASVHGKPAQDVIWYWFPRLLGEQ
jgi:hypothetical protein